MSSKDEGLTQDQKELVAIGASVAAGCQPCVSYHIKAGRKAGLGRPRMETAVTTAERVAEEAVLRMSEHARGRLGGDGTAASEPASPVDIGLAAYGAAITANSIADIEARMLAAVELGLTPPQLAEAIEVARAVQENAGRIHVREAQRLLDELGTLSEDDDEGECAPECPCSGEDEKPVGSGVPDVGTEPEAAGGDQSTAVAAWCDPADSDRVGEMIEHCASWVPTAGWAT